MALSWETAVLQKLLAEYLALARSLQPPFLPAPRLAHPRGLRQGVMGKWVLQGRFCAQVWVVNGDVFGL